jgi:hypothetical protein
MQIRQYFALDQDAVAAAMAAAMRREQQEQQDPQFHMLKVNLLIYSNPYV